MTAVMVDVDAPGTGREAGLLARVDQLEREVAALHAERDRLVAANAELHAKLEAARRAGKRQAAPFAKGEPAARPRRPGRKPRPGYGTRAWRPVPERIDRVVPVAAPSCCPGCAGPVWVERVVAQYQEDLPPARSEITRFDLELGRCQGCGRRVRGRDAEQVSAALGAAGQVLGPRAVALGTWLRVGLGLSAGKTCQVLAELGIRITPGGLVQAIARAARQAQPTYQALEQAVRASRAVAVDETGWRVGGRSAWLWAFVGEQVVVYRVADGRGYEQATAVLGEGFGGVLERDGWAPYRKFTTAAHQSCLAHLLRRCHGLVADAGDDERAGRIPATVAGVLGGLLAVRDRRDAGELTPTEAGVEAAVAGIVLDRLIAAGAPDGDEPGRKLLAHLGRERDALFTFLLRDGVQATNWRAEQAIRPAVVTRKVWGGNRTWPGAGAWQVLASVLATATLQQRDGVDLLAGLLRAPVPVTPTCSCPALHAGREPPAARCHGPLPGGGHRGERRSGHRGHGRHRWWVSCCHRRPRRWPADRRAWRRWGSAPTGASGRTHR